MTHQVKVIGGKTIRTADNPLNTWFRSLDDGKFYRREKLFTS